MTVPSAGTPFELPGDDERRDGVADRDQQHLADGDQAGGAADGEPGPGDDDADADESDDEPDHASGLEHRRDRRR